MSIYKIIKSLQDAQGTINKQQILYDNAHNDLLKNFMKAVYDPAINYYQTKLPKLEGWEGTEEFAQIDIDTMIGNLASRIVTGHVAESYLKGHASALNEEGRVLLGLMLKRSIGASVGDTMVLKTWPDLYFIPPYQRCSLMDSKIKAKFESLPKFVIQPKLDGSFMYLVTGGSKTPSEAITRAGSKYPQWFVDKLSGDLSKGFVLVGEAEVYEINDTGYDIEEKLLSRQEGNGLLNAVLQGRDKEEFKNYKFVLTVWDKLTLDEFEEGKSEQTYKDRMKVLMYMDSYNGLGDNIKLIETGIVDSLEKAFQIYSSYTSEGLEGAVIKSLDSVWKNGTAKDIVKLKITFEADYKITGYYEGEGKASGMLGGLEGSTSDGLLQFKVGTGFSDKLRKELWEIRDTLVDKVMTCKANDIVSKRTDDIKSLFLPVFSEVRFDKNVADNLSHVENQLEAAKKGV